MAGVKCYSLARRSFRSQKHGFTIANSEISRNFVIFWEIIWKNIWALGIQFSSCSYSANRAWGLIWFYCCAPWPNLNVESSPTFGPQETRDFQYGFISVESVQWYFLPNGASMLNSGQKKCPARHSHCHQAVGWQGREDGRRRHKRWLLDVIMASLTRSQPLMLCHQPSGGERWKLCPRIEESRWR